MRKGKLQITVNYLHCYHRKNVIINKNTLLVCVQNILYRVC